MSAFQISSRVRWRDGRNKYLWLEQAKEPLKSQHTP